ncbi:MAG: hypothetical protein HKP39_06230 [Eudoraea sp.]|nr:hypothetical protein [Eudoraea sp.]
MELQELQTLWSQMSRELADQKKLTNDIIMKMTQEKYVNKFGKIAVYETIGAVICFAAALYVLFNFGKLEVWYLQLCGIFTLLFLIILPILTLRSLRRIKEINVVENSFVDTIVQFTKAKNQLLLLQRVGIYLSFLLMFTTLPVASKLLKNKDLFLETDIWYVYLPIMGIFLFFFTRWGYGCYKNITSSAESILSELE